MPADLTNVATPESCSCALVGSSRHNARAVTHYETGDV